MRRVACVVPDALNDETYVPSRCMSLLLSIFAYLCMHAVSIFATASSPWTKGYRTSVGWKYKRARALHGSHRTNAIGTHRGEKSGESRTLKSAAGERKTNQ